MAAKVSNPRVWRRRWAGIVGLVGVLLLVSPRAAGATTDLTELTEPTVVVDVTWEHMDGLIMVYSAAHENNGDPTVNPAGGISASSAAGCDPDAIIYGEPLPLVLTTDSALDLGYYATASEPGNYSIVVYSGGDWCAYYTTVNGIQQADNDRWNALRAELPEGTEITVTATVTYYNIPGAETQVFTGKVPISDDAFDASLRRVIGSVVLPDSGSEVGASVSEDGADDEGEASADSNGAEGEVGVSSDGGDSAGGLGSGLVVGGVVVVVLAGAAVAVGVRRRGGRGQALMDGLLAGELTEADLSAEDRKLVESAAAAEILEKAGFKPEPEVEAVAEVVEPFEATKEVTEPVEDPELQPVTEEVAKPPPIKLGPVGYDPGDKTVMGEFGELFVSYNLGNKDTAVKIGGFSGLWNPDSKAWTVEVDKAVTLTGGGGEYTVVTGDRVFSFDDNANQLTVEVPGLTVQGGGAGWSVAKGFDLDSNNQLTVFVGSGHAKGATLVSQVAPNVSLQTSWEQFDQVNPTGGFVKTHTSTVKLNVGNFSIEKTRGSKPLPSYNVKF